MTVINKQALIQRAPIKNMLEVKTSLNGVSHGLAEVGYDIRIKQGIAFVPNCLGFGQVSRIEPCGSVFVEDGNFILASAIEEFDMPDNLVGIVHDKSTWARRGLSVFNTVIEPGWKGFLTMELVFHGSKPLYIEAGTGIAQVVFHHLATPVLYEGKYQNQADRPVDAAFVG